MATGNLDVSGVASLGGSSYDLTVDSTTGVTVGDDVGCPLAAGGSGGYSVTAIPDGTSLTVSAKTDALGATFGAPGTTGTGADNAWFSTPDASGNVIVPESAPGGSWAWAEQLGSGSSTVLPGVCQARLSTSSTDPLAESGTAATIYLTPHTGNQLSVYVTSAWQYVTLSSAPSITLSTLTADTVYDIFCDETPTLNAVAWTNDTTRATALTRQDGALIETSSSHLYVGTIKLNASKQIVYDTTGRAIWNEHNRVRVATQALETTDSWTRDSATWRQANGSTSNQVEILLGRAVDAIDARVGCLVNHSTAATQNLAIGIGIDSTTTNSAQLWGTPAAAGTVEYPQATASYAGTPAEGARSIKWLERGSGTATNTFFGDNAGNIGGGLVVTSWH